MATIIKHNTSHEAPAGQAVQHVAFDFQDLAGHADEYVEKVRREAAKIVQQANAEAEAIRQKAERAGREAAEAAVEKVLEQKVASQMRTIRPALDQLINQLADARGAWLDHWDRSAVGLAARMASRVVRSELERRPEITLTWVREALEMAAGASEITVRLNPQDHANLGPQAEQIAESIGHLAPARLLADASVSPGGCRVDTRHGGVDQQVESQLAQLVEELS